MYPEDLKYTKQHEWVRIDGNLATVGITHFAQDQLGAIVGIGLPDEGMEITKDSELADLDSMKTADQVFSPVSGKIKEVNEVLDSQPELLNEDPYGDGWVVVIEMDNPKEIEEMMSSEEYKAYITTETGE